MIIFSVLLVQLWLVSILWRTDRDLKEERKFTSMVWRQVLDLSFCPAPKVDYNRVKGITDQLRVEASVATKMADRAFNMASSANLGVVALQKALATPRLMTKQQSQANQLAKNSVDEIFTTQGSFDWLKPLMNDDDLEVVEEIEQRKLKEQMTKQSQ